MYKVIKAFYDLQDVKQTKGGSIFHEYRVGDEFPRPGKTVSEERIAELASSYNAQGTPVIEEVYTGTAADPEKMTKAELIAFAEKNGIPIDTKAKKDKILEQVMNTPSEEGAEDAE